MSRSARDGVAYRLALARGVTLDELAGVPSDRVKLEGPWWTAWQTFSDGDGVTPISPLA